MSAITDRLDEIEARAAAATEGPWQAELSHGDDDSVPITSPGTDLDNPVAAAAIDDALFIAAARTDVPALTKALRDVVAACDPATGQVWAHYSSPRGRVDVDYIRSTITAALAGA